MYKLVIEAKTKSKAKILGISIPQYVFGKNFEVYYVLKNIGENQASPEGRFQVIIKWQGTELGETQWYDVPRLNPGQPYFTGMREWGVLSHLGSFHIIETFSEHHPQFKLHTVDGHELDSRRVFHAVFGIPIEGFYEYLALWISAGGLAIIAGETLLRLVKWLFTCGG